MKRIVLFLAVNMLVMLTIGTLTSLLGVGPYITQAGLDYSNLMIICLLWGMGGSFISLLLSKFMAKMMMGLKVLSPTGPESQLVQMVHRIAVQAGLSKMPEVAIYESNEVNAFATGPSRNNSLVAVSRGLLNSMSSDEVEGVVAHEVAHIANGDMVTMALVTGVVNAFVFFFAKIITFAIDSALRDDDGRGGLGGISHFFVSMGLQIVFSILAMPIIAWFSRYREYRADRGSAQYAGKEKMIRALMALQRNYGRIDKGESNVAAMKISSKEGWSALFSTHPPLEERIKALKDL